MLYRNLSDLKVPAVAVGCMRIAGLSPDRLSALVDTAIAGGANFFDHADIYGGGECERAFGRLLSARPRLREKVIIQSKCGIRLGMYDFSKSHIIESVDGILSRLGTDRLDLLLLHRPDALMEPGEVCEAFTELAVVKYYIHTYRTYPDSFMRKYDTLRVSSEIHVFKCSLHFPINHAIYAL